MQACRLAAVDLACRRGDRLLLRGVNFDVGSGDALHLAGPNGVGKSSLIRILAGLLRPFNGRVERKGTLALADERTALDPHRSLEDSLGFWSRLDGITSEKMLAAAERLGLTDLLSVPVRYLSTGQRKRAVLARVLAGNVPIWLLDEPLNGLDVAACATLERTIAEHGERGGIAVIASHQAIVVPRLQRIELAAWAPAQAEA